MNDTSPNRPLDDTVLETLVAYLDGELSPAESAVVEQRLAVDADYREALRTMQRAWSFLDELPQSSPSVDFSNSTITMVAQATTRSISKSSRNDTGWMPWVFGALAMTVMTVASYAMATKFFLRPEQQFLRDLPVIQNVDMYRNIEDIEFLRSLIQDGPFATVEENTDA